MCRKGDDDGSGGKSFGSSSVAEEEVVWCEYRSLADVKRCGKEIRRRWSSTVDTIVHCAGVMFPRETMTDDGWETTMQVNCIAPVVLTNILLAGREAHSHCRYRPQGDDK